MNLESALGVGFLPSYNSKLSDQNNSYEPADDDRGPPDILLPVWGQWLKARDALSAVDDRFETEELIRASNSAELFLYYSEYLLGRGHKDELLEDASEKELEQYIGYTPIIDRYDPWLIEDKNNILYSNADEIQLDDNLNSKPQEREPKNEEHEDEKAVMIGNFQDPPKKSSHWNSFFIDKAIRELKKSPVHIQTPRQISQL